MEREGGEEREKKREEEGAAVRRERPNSYLLMNFVQR